VIGPVAEGEQDVLKLLEEKGIKGIKIET